jgi:hypothetical protein
MLSLSGPRAPKLAANFGGLTRKLYRWTRSCFLSSPPQGPADRQGLSLSSTQLLTTWVTWADFSPLSGAPVTPVSRQTSPRSVPSTGGRSACLEPVGSVRRDPKLNSRRPGRTLGQTRPARQGLVRVPESNTKYGGKGGITGGDPAPVMGPSIGESTRIPKTKKLFGHVETGFAPLFTGQVFFWPIGLHWRDSREATEREVWHVRAPVVGAADTGHGGRRFHRFSVPFSVPCRAP